MLNVYFTYAGKAGGNPWMMTEQDLVVAYSGSGTVSRLEGALQGPMSTMLPPDEMNIVIDWVHAGADRAGYDRDVRPIVDKRCLVCHDGSNPHIPNLFGYDNIKKVTESDTGAKISTLVRVSHIHMFGVPFIFFIMGLMFSHAYVRPVWFKCAVIALPFLAVMVDVSSWYIIKIYHPFAWVEIFAGMADGRVLRLHVGGDDVPAVVLSAASDGRRATGRRYSQLALTGARPGSLQVAKAEPAR